MNKLREKITYAGFTPSLTDADHGRRLVEAIEQMAPSDSSVRLKVTSTQGGFKGTIKVNSSSGRFRAEDTSASLDELLGKLSTQICVQIDHWKRGRFEVHAG